MAAPPASQPASQPPSPKARILVVEDEEDLLELVRFNLAREGYQVQGLARGEEALRAVRAQPPDLLLLDLMLPGMDGLELCRLLRADEATRAMPIVMLTAKGEESDVVAGLELGADDYITKPFSPRVLLARVRAVLRRRVDGSPAAGGALQVHQIAIHPGRREVTVDGRPVSLTFTEFNILHFLARRPGWVFTRGQIMDAARGEDYHVTERSVDVQMVNLRKKLGPAGRHLQTVRGVGYRLAE
jgi:two-component system phosphate regulon response regulator PhoB